MKPTTAFFVLAAFSGAAADSAHVAGRPPAPAPDGTSGGILLATAGSSTADPAPDPAGSPFESSDGTPGPVSFFVGNHDVFGGGAGPGVDCFGGMTSDGATSFGADNNEMMIASDENVEKDDTMTTTIVTSRALAVHIRDAFFEQLGGMKDEEEIGFGSMNQPAAAASSSRRIQPPSDSTMSFPSRRSMARPAEMESMAMMTTEAVGMSAPSAVPTVQNRFGCSTVLPMPSTRTTTSIGSWSAQPSTTILPPNSP